MGFHRIAKMHRRFVKEMNKGLINTGMLYFFFSCIFLPECAAVQREDGKTSYGYKSSRYVIPPEGIITVSDLEKVCWIELTGAISPEAESAFRSAADDADRRGCSVTWVILDSQGGSVASGMRIGQMVRDRGYWTSLSPSGGQCASACGSVFISGVKREIPDSTWGNKIGFHQASYIGPDGKKHCDEVDGIVSRMSLLFAKRMLPESAAVKFHQYRTQAACSSIKFITAPELVASGIATGKGGPNVF